jgi:hypothetical protein
MNEFVQLLPRDLERDGRTFAQIYRSHLQGGRIVYLRNSEPGIARGHTIHVFQIAVVDNKEELGDCLLVTPSADKAIELAGKVS